MKRDYSSQTDRDLLIHLLERVEGMSADMATHGEVHNGIEVRLTSNTVEIKSHSKAIVSLLILVSGIFAGVATVVGAMMAHKEIAKALFGMLTQHHSFL